MAEKSVFDLLQSYSAVLDELKRRQIVRTSNAPIGDIAEYGAALFYQGVLAPNSEKSYDLTTEDGARAQVKVRSLGSGPHGGQGFSPLRSLDFDFCTFIVIDKESCALLAASEWSPEEVREFGSFRSHVAGWVVRTSRVTSHSIGRNITAEFGVVWDRLLTSVANAT